MTKYKCPCGSIDTHKRSNIQKHLTCKHPCQARIANPQLCVADTIVPGTTVRIHSSIETSKDIVPNVTKGFGSLQNNLHPAKTDIHRPIPFGSQEEVDYIVRHAESIVPHITRDIKDGNLLFRYIANTFLSNDHPGLRNVCVPCVHDRSLRFYEHDKHAQPVCIVRDFESALRHLCTIVGMQLKKVYETLDPCDIEITETRRRYNDSARVEVDNDIKRLLAARGNAVSSSSGDDENEVETIVKTARSFARLPPEALASVRSARLFTDRKWLGGIRSILCPNGDVTHVCRKLYHEAYDMFIRSPYNQQINELMNECIGVSSTR